MQTLMQDLRYGARMLLKMLGFTLIAVITLALGIGANTAIFSVVNAVLLKPLPYEQADRLVFLAENGENFGEMSVSFPNYQDWRAQQTLFENIGVYNRERYNLTGSGEPEQLQAANATADLLTALKVKPLLGRLYTSDEDKPGATPVVVLSHALWQRRFGGDARVVNQTITLNERRYTVLGVTPPGFLYPSRIEMWIPAGQLSGRESWQNRGSHPGLYGVVRPKPGVTVKQARTEMNVIAERLAQAYPASNKGNSAVVVSLKERIVGDVERALFVILAAVGCVLLIACANVANLLLARAATRQREMAVRVALGASRWRIARQLLTESLILALLGGIPGLLLSQWAIDGLLKFNPAVLPRAGEIKTDIAVLGFTFLMALLTGLLFGLAPAWQAGRTDPHLALKDAGRGIAGGKARFRNALIITEVALTLVLLVGAGLLMRSFSQLLRVNPGFNYEGLLTFIVTLPEQKYPQLGPQMQFFQKLQERLSALPGVTQVAYSSGLPLGNNGWQTSFTIEGRPIPPPNETPSMEMTIVSSGYFETMKISLREGRWFDARDNREHLRGRDLSQLKPDRQLMAGLNSIVIDEEFARRHWPNESAVGKRIRLGTRPDDPLLTILGVVGRVKVDGLREETNRVQAYLPYLQGTVPNVFVTLRTSVDPTSLTNAAREAVVQIDPLQPIYEVNTMEKLRTDTIAPDRLNLLLLSSFAGLALVLALIGLYGVMSYAVTQRTQEMGLRMALGAQVGDVLRLVIGHGMKLVLLGIGLGVVLSFALTRLMERLLFGVSATDPLTFIVIVSLLIFVALLACWLPARRAMKVDPMMALRCE